MLGMSTWVTDMRHLAPAQPSKGAAAGTRRAAFVRAIVEAATSRAIESSWCSAIRCVARVGRKVCRARIHVSQPEAGRVEWSCTACGERGVITGFEGTALDLSSYVPRTKVRVWGFDDESREVLLGATTDLPSLRAVVARASPAAEVEGLLILQATLDELDQMYTLVEHLSEMTRSRGRLELLDSLRADLCAVMDGF
jgi:hypothetical protein